jgi:hypothetical protein
MQYQKKRPYSETLDEAEKWDEWLRDSANDGGETVSAEDVPAWVKRQTGTTATDAADARIASDRAPE